ERSQSSFDELAVGRTTIVIAHRLTTIRNADRIGVIENGTLVQEGTHSELIEAGGSYAELYEANYNNL
ncbi:MAG: multidrug ABC transporter ATP-binding protein, partial [Firmicutes bacterium]|nr:multidrug ABC transporter ATP-binding protein [Bacillota bacterium]